MNTIILNIIREMDNRHCRGGIGIYIDGKIYDRCADLSEVIFILNELDSKRDLRDARISVIFNDIDVVTTKGLKENLR